MVGQLRVVKLRKKHRHLLFVRPVPNDERGQTFRNAISPDCNVTNLVAIDHIGVAAALSYTLYIDRLHVFHVASLTKGAGSFLMGRIEALAEMAGVPVTLSALPASVQYYLNRGYRVTGPKPSGVMTPMKLSTA